MSKKTKAPLTIAQRRKKVKGHRKITIMIFSLFMLLVVGAGGVAAKVIYDVGNTWGNVYQPVQKIDYRSSESSSEESSVVESNSEQSSEESSEEEEDAQPISILLIGTDTGDFGRTSSTGLSDVLIYCVLNPHTKSMTLLSIPRDTRCYIVGYGSTEKINAAYMRGGAEMCINTVQNLLGLPVDYYAAVNFAGFQSLVDVIGGVTVDNSFTFSWDGYTFPEGTVTLSTGAEALAFCRMRKNDPEGDFGRNRRQRNVIVEICKKCVTMSGALNYNDILDAVEDNVLTDIDMDTALDMIDQYSVCLENVDSMETLLGTGVNEAGWYYELDESNLQQVCSELRTRLELDGTTDDSDSSDLDTDSDTTTE